MVDLSGVFLYTVCTVVAYCSKEAIVAILEIGITDKVRVHEVDRTLQLEFFTSGSNDAPNKILVLTKIPVQLVDALTIVLGATEEKIVEFAGENYTGRACVYPQQGQISFDVVFEFSLPKTTVYILRVDETAVRIFMEKVSTLSASPFPTD